MVRRLLFIWFPRLASDVSLRARPIEGQFTLTHRLGNTDQLHCMNLSATAPGLSRGMVLACARAICPELATRPSDLARDAGSPISVRRYALVGGTGRGDGLAAASAVAGTLRLMTIFSTEPVRAASGTPPASFRWRRVRFTTLRARGAERITAKWRFDDPAWRSVCATAGGSK